MGTKSLRTTRKYLPLIRETRTTNFLEHKQLSEHLRYLGVPVHDVDYGWGDYNTMITSGTVANAKLHKKRDNLLVLPL